jgi:serine/threonine protein phosphatase PrpC
MRVVSAHKSDIGQVYQRNDDYVWVDDEAGLYILADGMGGHEAGDVASSMTANSVGQAVAAQLATDYTAAQIKGILVRAIESANEAVFTAAQEAAQKRKMGTTIVLALLYASKAYISHAGDSRAYLIRDGHIRQLTEDDSWGAQFATSSLEVTQSEKGRFDHFLTKSVGQEEMLDPSFLEVQLEPGDWLLLCSDGLWNMVGDDVILAELLQAGDDPVPVVENLVAAANQAGGKDNISVVAVKTLP